MLVIRCDEFGPPSSLRVVTVSPPTPRAGQVLIQVTAVGVGFVDGLLIQGRYQIKPALPFVPGNEFAGRVVALGDGVSGELAVGDRVMGLASGAFAETLALPARACIRVPDGLTDPQAAGFLLNHATALYGLDDCGQLQSGESVLVLGASGGVGSATIAVGKAMGLHVIAAASTPEKVAAAVACGADAGVCYGAPDWRETLKTVLADRPLNAVMDPVGGNVAEPALRSLSPGGRFLVAGFAGGSVPAIALNLPLLKRCSIVGVDWGGASRADPALTPALAAKLLRLIADRRLKPPPVAVWPLVDVRSALQAQLAGWIMGKLVIDMSGAWPEEGGARVE
ncbi:MAG: NADPH:quinone oxidoreductase family protein [Pseudomonadales bacterium]|nr:NADPH:quinone oxidoreductase family protein [Pseudomonadales bacterium]